MSSDSLTRTAGTDVKTSATPDVEKPTVDQVIEDVRRDSRREADQYLKDSSVPHGGE
jgi:hypothetical protein